MSLIFVYQNEYSLEDNLAGLVSTWMLADFLGKSFKIHWITDQQYMTLNPFFIYDEIPLSSSCININYSHDPRLDYGLLARYMTDNFNDLKTQTLTFIKSSTPFHFALYKNPHLNQDGSHNWYTDIIKKYKLLFKLPRIIGDSNKLEPSTSLDDEYIIIPNMDFSNIPSGIMGVVSNENYGSIISKIENIDIEWSKGRKDLISSDEEGILPTVMLVVGYKQNQNIQGMSTIKGKKYQYCIITDNIPLMSLLATYKCDIVSIPHVYKLPGMISKATSNSLIFYHDVMNSGEQGYNIYFRMEQWFKWPNKILSNDISRFDWKFYMSYYGDLYAANLRNEELLRKHYREFGRREKRFTNANQINGIKNICSNPSLEFYLSKIIKYNQGNQFKKIMIVGQLEDYQLKAFKNSNSEANIIHFESMEYFEFTQEIDLLYVTDTKIIYELYPRLKDRIVFMINNLEGKDSHLETFISDNYEDIDLMFYGEVYIFRKIVEKINYDVYVVAYKETPLLETFLDYYKDANKILVYDNLGSEYIKTMVKNSNRNCRKSSIKNDYDARLLKNTIWRDSIGKAQYLLMLDIKDMITFPNRSVSSGLTILFLRGFTHSQYKIFDPNSIVDLNFIPNNQSHPLGKNLKPLSPHNILSPQVKEIGSSVEKLTIFSYNK